VGIDLTPGSFGELDTDRAGGESSNVRFTFPTRVIGQAKLYSVLLSPTLAFHVV
jgi:hypothetical protein